MFRRVTFLLMAAFLGLTMALGIGLGGRVSAETDLTLAANCNLGGGIVLAQGVRHVPAGESNISRLPNGFLRVSNIGSSGLDGVCMEESQSQWAGRDLSDIDMNVNNRLVRWTVNGREGNEPRRPLSELTVRNQNGNVQVFLNETLDTNSTKMQVLFGDELTFEGLIPTNGLVGDLSGPIDLAGTEKDTWIYCLTCTLQTEGELPPFVVAIMFETVIEVTVPGGPTVVGDVIRYELPLNVPVTYSDDSYEFANISQVTIEEHHFFVNGLKLTPLAGRAIADAPEGSVMVSPLTDPFSRLNIDQSYECLTCTLALNPDAPVGPAIQGWDEGVAAVFAEPLALQSVGDRVAFDYEGVNGAGTAVEIGDISIERVPAGTRICADFFNPIGVPQWRIQVTRNGQTVVNQQLDDGSCLTTQRQIALLDATFDVKQNQPVFFTSHINVQGLPGNIVMNIGPATMNVPATLLLTDVTFDSTVPYTALINGIE